MGAGRLRDAGFKTVERPLAVSIAKAAVRGDFGIKETRENQWQSIRVQVVASAAGK